MAADLDSLIYTAVNSGGPLQKRAAARLISRQENSPRQRLEILARLYPYAGYAYTIGITGPPGAGKSTITDKLARLLLQEGHKVAIIAIDPSSPYSGGAILGDRIRMNDLTLEENIFIRSLGSRGALGGLSEAVFGAAQIFNACGCDYIIIETVGVGQAECEIRRIADTTIVVSVPGLGDDIQMIKAGVLEIGDILLVNKADREGADQLATMLRLKQQLATAKDSGWRPPVLLSKATQAGADNGLPELWRAIKEHRQYLEQSGRLKEARAEHLEANLRHLLQSALVDKLLYGGKNGFNSADKAGNDLAAEPNPYERLQKYLESLEEAL